VAPLSPPLCGLGLGGHVGLMAFFAGRYFGLKAYGKIYGTMFGLFVIGSGIGPYVAGLSFDLHSSYRPALMGFAVCLLASSVLFAPLGPYRFGSREATKSRQTRSAALAPVEVKSLVQR
jgi:MFS family permease